MYKDVYFPLRRQGPYNSTASGDLQKNTQRDKIACTCKESSRELLCPIHSQPSSVTEVS